MCYILIAMIQLMGILFGGMMAALYFGSVQYSLALLVFLGIMYLSILITMTIEVGKLLTMFRKSDKELSELKEVSDSNI